MKRVLFATLVFGLFLVFSLSTYAAESLRLSMLPLYSSTEIDKRIRPLAKLLSKAIGAQVEPVIVSDFKSYEQRLGSDIDIGFENPVVYVRSPHEALAVIYKEPDGAKFRGLIITRSDSPISSPDELVGKRVAIVGPTSAGGYLSQRQTLLELGIDTKKDMTLVVALDNKQENVIFSTYNGDVDAGFIRESALRSAASYIPPNQIKIIKKTAYIPEWVLSVRRDLPAKTKMLIRNTLIDLTSGDPVLNALKIKAFQETNDRNYDVVRRVLGLPVSS